MKMKMKNIYVLTNVKKKINIDKIRTNSHEFHSEIGHSSTLKIP